MGLRRKRAIAFKIEDPPGTFDAPAISDGKLFVINPTYTITPLVFERNVSQPSLTRHPRKVAGASQVEFSFGVELAGHPTNDGIAAGSMISPHLDTLLRACGYQRKVVKRMLIGAITSGPFQFGEDIEIASTKQGEAASDMYDGQTIFPVVETGTLSAAAITGATSGATATASAVDAYDSLVWHPTSTEPAASPTANDPVALSMSMWRDGKLTRGAGMRGTWRAEHTHGDRVLIQFTMRGIFQDETDEVIPTQTFQQLIPPPWINTQMRLQDDTLGIDELGVLVINTVTLDAANEVVVRENTNKASGYELARIVGRDPSIAFNPDEVLDVSFPFNDNFNSGTISRLEWIVGSVAGNTWLFRAPGLVATTDADAERDTVDQHDLTMQASGGQYPNGDVGADQEIIIMNY